MRFVPAPALSTTGVRNPCCSGADVGVGARVGVGVAVGNNGAAVDVGVESEAIERTGVAVGFVCGVAVATADVEGLQAIAASAKRPNADHIKRGFRNCPVLCYYALLRRALPGARYRPIKLRRPQW